MIRGEREIVCHLMGIIVHFIVTQISTFIWGDSDHSESLLRQLLASHCDNSCGTLCDRARLALFTQPHFSEN